MNRYDKAVRENLRRMFPHDPDTDAAHITPNLFKEQVLRICPDAGPEGTIRYHIAEEMAACELGLSEGDLERIRSGKSVRINKERERK